MTWHSPLRLATLAEKAFKRADELRAEADRLEAKGNDYAHRYEQAMAPHRARLEKASTP
jgi:uncharacterized protein YbaP (TraB family)